MRRNYFRLKKENKTIKNRVIEDTRNLFKLNNENKSIKNRVIRNISNLFQYEEQENYQKPV